VHSLFSFFIRIFAFLRKEIYEILRQPRLVLTLVLGPFLILLLFGIGYRVQAQPLRTEFVMSEDSPFRQYLEEYTSSVSPLVHYAGVTDNLSAAQARLRAGEIDAVVALPDNPVETIRSSEQAVFLIYHNEIDPFQVDYVRVFGRLYVDEVNRRVLSAVAGEGQTESVTVQQTVSEARASAAALRGALESNDPAAARTHQADLARHVAAMARTMGANNQVVASVENTFGVSGEEESLSGQLSTLEEETNSLGDNPQLEQVQRIEEQLGSLETVLGEFREIEPAVLVSPFRSEVQTISGLQIDLADYFVPAAIALLTQHLAVTFAALSIVREVREGAMELFRVSPLSAFETLIGKYLSYFVFESLLVTILTLLILFGLRVPLVGGWQNYVLVIATLIFTSLGLGFVLSLLAKTTSQAVQYAMIVLLASIFFTGFFLSLNYLWAPVRVVSWMLPATYAIDMLQNIMLRGNFVPGALLWSLLAMGVGFFIVAWLLLRRLMVQK
jgi:ABC-2 type transport system permease protein